MGTITNPISVPQLKQLTGVVDHGLFVRMASEVIVADSATGCARVADTESQAPWW